MSSSSASTASRCKRSRSSSAHSSKRRVVVQIDIGCYKDMKLTKPVLILDNEKGSRFLIPILKKAGIQAIAKDTTHLRDITHLLNFSTR